MTDSLEREIRELRALYWSERDPEGRGFAPLADAYLRAGSLTDALEVLQEGLERHPRFATGHVVAARIHRAAGALGEARASLEAALDLDGENTEALAELASLREEQGRSDEALSLLKRLSVVRPGDEALADRIRVLEESAEAGAAELDFEPLSFDTGAFDPEALGEESETDSEEGTPVPSVLDEEADLRAFGEPPEVAVGPVEGAAHEGDLDPGSEPRGDAPEVAVGPVEGAAQDDESDVDGDWHLPEDAAPDVDEEEELFTQTLAELYAEQGLVSRAVEVYRRLLREDPDNETLQSRLAALETHPEAGPDRTELAGPPDEETAPDLDSSAPEDAGTTPEIPVAAVDVAPGARTAPTREDEVLEALAEDMARGPDDDAELSTPFAWSPTEPGGDDEQAAGPALTEYLGELLAWRPSGPLPAAVDVTDLAPEPGPSAAPGPRRPLDAAGAEGEVVPIESLSPEGGVGGDDPESGGDSVARFQDWMDRLKK